MDAIPRLVAAELAAELWPRRQPDRIADIRQHAHAAGGRRRRSNRLLLFPGTSSQITLTSGLTRRHTHSIILRHRPGVGVDAWVDGTFAASGVGNPLTSSAPVPMVLLHDTTMLGGAQCWLHEAATWERALTDTEAAVLLQCAARWVRGPSWDDAAGQRPVERHELCPQ